MLLQVTQVPSHHHHVGAPLFLKADEHAHANRVNSCLSHAVKAVAAPFEYRLHATRMIVLVVLAMIGLLEADHAIHAVIAQFLIVLGLQRHHLDLDVREVFLCDVDCLSQIWHTSLCRILARHEQDIFERSKLLDGAIFVLYLFGSEDDASHRVLAVEAAVDTGVAARVGDIERDEHRHCLAKSLFGVFARESCHCLKIWLGCWREKSHEVVYVAMTLRQCATHIHIGFRGNLSGCLVPVILF